MATVARAFLLPLLLVARSSVHGDPEWLGDPSCPYFVEEYSYFSVYQFRGQPLDVGLRKARFFPQENVTVCRANMEDVVNANHAALGDSYRAYLLKVENATSPGTEMQVTAGNTTVNKAIVVELAFIKCVPTVDSILAFVDRTDVRAYATFSSSLPLGKTPEESAELCRVWSQIVKFGIYDAKRVDLSSLLLCEPLVNMYHLVIRNTTMSEYPEGFNQHFIGLTDLELDKNNLSLPPQFFWPGKVVKMFRNFSFSQAMYDDYTDHGALSTGPDEFKLGIILDDNSIADLQEFEFHGCLEMVSLKNNLIQGIGVNTFANLSCVRLLELCGNNLTDIPLSAFDNMTEVRKLGLCKNQLKEIRIAHLASMTHLKRLNLGNNQITYIEPGLFQQLLHLEEVSIEGNHLDSIPEGLLEQKNLTSLNLGFNNLHQFPLGVFSSDSLQTVSLKGTSINTLNFTDLCEQYLSGELTLSVELFSSGKGARHIDLTQSAPLQVYMSVQDSVCRAAVKAILCSYQFQMDTLHCGCEVLGTASFLRTMLANSTCANVRQNAWSCASPEELRGRSLLSLLPEETYCPVQLAACPGACQCFRRAGGARRVIVDCRARGLTALPERLPEGVELELWLEDNALSALAPRPYLARLHALRLARNALARLEAPLLAQLDALRQLDLEANLLAALPRELARFSRQLQRLRLSSNPLRCDCHARWLQTWVASRPPALEDGEAITCNLAGRDGAGVLLTHVPADELVCLEDAVRARVALQAAVPSALLLLLAVGLGIAGLFRRQLKLWLYVHTSWHPFDRDPPTRGPGQGQQEEGWDVAVVCGLEEDAWVWSQVSARLEQEQGLRVLHCWRDFRLGLTHGQNLARAAARCRRLLLVLTPESLGERLVGAAVRVGLEAARHHRANFLVLLLHGCRTLQTADPRLKEAMKAGRFISTKDPHFFKKLMYFMPVHDNQVHPEVPRKLSKPAEGNQGVAAVDAQRDNPAGADVGNGSVVHGTDIHLELVENVPARMADGGPLPAVDGDAAADGGKKMRMLPLKPATDEDALQSLPVFVWYHSQDFPFVMERLVTPLLDSDVQWVLEDKDFLPGVAKDQNILLAVEASRCTLVVLSAASLRDEWSLHAFQVALNRQMAGRRHVVALCMRRDCPEGEMDKEMQQFLHSSTSLSEDSSWFQDRLLQLCAPEEQGLKNDEQEHEQI